MKTPFFSAILSLLITLLAFSYLEADPRRIRELEDNLILAKDTVRANMLNELSILYAKSDLQHADSLANLSMILLGTLDYPKGSIRNYNGRSYIKAGLGEFNLAIEYVSKAIEISEELGNQELLGASYDHLFAVLFQRGETIPAKEAALTALSVAEESGLKSLCAKSYDNLGMVSGTSGEHFEAVDYFLKSLALYDELNDKEAKSRILSSIGHTFELAGSYPKALEYLRSALKLNRESANDHNEAWTLVNIGVVHSRLNQSDSAMIYYQESLKIAEEIKNHRLILTCLDNIGGKYTLLKDFDNSNLYLNRAYRLSETSGQNSRTVYISGNLAENYLQMGMLDSARFFAEKQLALALSASLIAEQKEAYSNLSNIYEASGDFASAYNALENYVKVNDSIFSLQKSKQIEELRESYEAEIKEDKIAKLLIANESSRYKNIAYGLTAITFLIFGALLYYFQKLRTGRKQLELEKEKELDRMKSRFFANISHEFRTPLTLILSPLDEIISSVENSGITRKLQVLKTNATRLLDLVNQLLDLSKIESGKLALNITETDVIMVLRGIAMSYDSLAEQKGIKLQLDVADEHLLTAVDRNKFETIIINLLSNAFRFTPNGGKVWLKAERRMENSSTYLIITVSDSGSGIPMEDLENIFNRFYQSHNSGEVLIGSGIGLALVKELVELHQGNIVAKNGLVGVTFSIRIPTNLPVSETQQAVVSKLPEVQVEHQEAVGTGIFENSDSKKPIILFIEDHRDVRNYLVDIFGDHYQVLLADNGEAGIEKAIELVPDLIVSDVMMPKKDGYEVCHKLKNDERTSHIPIVLLTAKSDQDARIEGYESLADDYVSKPFVPRELLVRVKTLIDNRARLRAKYQQDGIIRPKEIAVSSLDEKFLNRLVELVEENLDNEGFGVEQLGTAIGMSRSQLHRKLTALINQGPNQFIRSFRLQRAHDLVKQNSATTAEIAYQVGFSSPSYFTKCFHEQFGYTPSSLQNSEA